MKKEIPIAMPSNNRFVPQQKKQLYPISPERLEVIKRLRADTGAGLHDCKTALSKAGWDYEKAKESLRYWMPGPLVNIKVED